jgi:hypothetical protein
MAASDLSNFYRLKKGKYRRRMAVPRQAGEGKVSEVNP